MSQEKKKQQKKAEVVDYAIVNTYMLNDAAYNGTLVHSTVNGEDRQFLIVSDSKANVIDVQSIEYPGQRIQFGRPVTVLSSNDDVSAYIPNGFYAYGKRCDLVQNGHDITSDMFYDRSFGQSRYALSRYEEQQVWQVALSAIDDTFKNEKNKNELHEYLSRAVQLYYDYSYDLRAANNSYYDKDQYAKIGDMDKELRATFSNTDQQSFMSDIRKLASDLHQEKIRASMQQLYESSVSGDNSRFDRAMSERELSDSILKLRYYETADSVSENFHKQLVATGIVDVVGKTNAESYTKLNDALRREQGMLERSISNGDPADTIIQRRDFVMALSDLSAAHPQNLQHNTSQYLSADVAKTFIEYGHNKDMNLTREYSGDTLNTVRERIEKSDSEYKDLLYDAINEQKMFARYSFMPNINVHATVSEHLGAHTGYAADPLTFTDRTYQNMSQQEFYEYLVAKSKIIHELSEEHIKASDSNSENKYTKIFENTSAKDEKTGLALTETERLRRVADALSSKLGIPEGSGAERFFESAEFANIIKNPEAMYVKRGDVYIQYANGTTSAVTNAVLRPEYAIDMSKIDIHSAQTCQSLLKNIQSQMEFDSLLKERPSQDLRAMHQFVTDHVKYNETIRSAEFNSMIASGIDSQTIRYSNLTQHILNDINQSNVREALRELNRAGIIDVDFSSKPDAHRVVQNYESLQHASGVIDERIMNMANSIASSLRGGHVTSSSEQLSQNLSNNIKAIHEAGTATERAELILSSLSIEHKGKLTASQINEISGVDTVAALETAVKQKSSASELTELTESLKQSYLSGITYTRGCDEFTRDEHGVILKSGITKNDIEATNRLDIATAVRSRSSENAYDVALDVISNQELRNNLIDRMQNAVSHTEEYAKNMARIDTFNRLHDLPNGITDAGSTISPEQRAIAISEAFGFALSKDEKSRASEVVILNSSEILNAIHDLQDKIAHENFATTRSNYTLRLEKTNGLEEYKQIINDLRGTEKYDVSLIGDMRYMEYLREDMSKSGMASAHIVSAIETVQTENGYTRLLTACRNIEEMTHGSSLTYIEENILKRVGSDIAFRTAMQDVGREDAIGTMESRVVKNHMYQQMISDAADANHTSSYMARKIETDTAAINVSVKTLAGELDTAFRDNFRVSNGVVVPQNESGRVSQSHYMIHEAIRSPHSLEILKTDLMYELQHNQNYKAYRENNNHGETLKQIEGIEKQIQFKQDCEKTSLAIIDEYHEKSKGFHIHNYEKWERNERDRLERLREDIRELESQKYQLEDSIRNTNGVVDQRLLDSRHAFQRNESLESASSYAEKMLDVYGDTAAGKGLYRHQDQPKGSAAESLRLCENLSASDIPISVRIDSYNVRIALAEDVQKKCAEEARAICERRISEISEAFQPNAQTTITSAVIQAAIDTSASRLESASPQEKIGIQHDIDKYTSMREEMATVMKIRDEIQQSSISHSLMDIAAKMHISTYQISEQYAEATRHLELARTDKAELEKFDAARNAYIGLDHIAEKTSHMSQAERSNMADRIYEDQKPMSCTNIIQKIEKSEKSIAHSDEMRVYLRAYQELHENSSSTKIFLEKLETYKDSKSLLTLNMEDLNALRRIDNYNIAIDNLRPMKSDVRDLMHEISGTMSGTNILAREMFSEIRAPHLDAYTEHYILRDYPSPEIDMKQEKIQQAVIDRFDAATSEEKSNIISNVVSKPVGEYQWPGDGAKMALLSISEFGLDKSMSIVGDPMLANDLVSFYQENMRRLQSDAPTEAKELLDRCRTLVMAVDEKQDTKHTLMLEAIDKADRQIQEQNHDEYSA